ncbi:MAG: hypothetical protein ACW99G_19195, partial [Candidatus Thorarchaeota archaeon]
MIVTRGLGSNTLITQGYGWMSVEEALGIISLSIDSILRASKAASVNLDAYLIAAIAQYDKDVSIDAIFRRVGITPSTSVDAILKQTDISKYVTLSAILRREDVTVSLNLDAFLKYIKQLSVAVEAVLRKSILAGVDLDAILSKQEARFADILIDAVLFAIGHPNKIFDYDAITTMSIDALDTTFEAEATEAFRKWIPRT